jgi:acyl-CoA synthetase (AMP-forming)/AMP-acid ligase II
MSPFAFLKDPLVWLRTITKYRGEITAAPNFAFTRCVLAWERMPAERRPHLDLSSLLFACNAAEPIRPSTLADFQATFGPVGFSTTAMCPAYGLAEHVVYAGTMAARPHQPTVIDPDTGFVACAVVGSNSDIDLQLMSFGGDEEGAPPSPVPPGATGGLGWQQEVVLTVSLPDVGAARRAVPSGGWQGGAGQRSLFPAWATHPPVPCPRHTRLFSRRPPCLPQARSG